MIKFYTVVDGLLDSAGETTEKCLTRMREEGQDVRFGAPAGFVGGTPFPGARWHVASAQWVDTNDAAQQAAELARRVMENRHSSYPPIADFVDAYYWQARGDGSKMDAYLAACDAVKQRFPKG